MNPRERLTAVLKGEIPDRVPVSFFVQEEFLQYYYPDRDRIHRLEEAVDCAGELGFDVMVRGKEFELPHFMKKSFPNWELNKYEKIDGDNLYVVFEVDTPKGKLRQVEVGPAAGKAAGGIHRSTVEYLIKDEQDFEVFTSYVPRIDMETVNAMKEYAEYGRKVIGNTGICVPWGWAGVYNQASNYRNVQDLMMDPYLNPGFYEAYMTRITDLEVEYNSMLAGMNIDGVGIQGNIANSGMVGRDFFTSYILPYEKRLVDAVKSVGKFTVYHNCGKARVLQKCYVEMGLDAWETVAGEPQGDNSLPEAKKEVGGSLVLIGNIDQVDFLKTASIDQVRAKTEELVNTGKPGGRYIFAGSDFLEKDTPIDNIKAAIDAAKAAGVY